MIPENLTAMAFALAIIIRMACFINLMRAGVVPQRCILGVLLLGVAAIGVLLAPLWPAAQVEFSWSTATFVAAVCLYVWTDRRRPTRSAEC